jgi:hypothetical protein
MDREIVALGQRHGRLLTLRGFAARSSDPKVRAFALATMTVGQE